MKGQRYIKDSTKQRVTAAMVVQVHNSVTSTGRVIVEVITEYGELLQIPTVSRKHKVNKGDMVYNDGNAPLGYTVLDADLFYKKFQTE